MSKKRNKKNRNKKYAEYGHEQAGGYGYAQGRENRPAAAWEGQVPEDALMAGLAGAGALSGLPDFLRSRHTEQFLLGLVAGGAVAWLLTDEELRGKLLKLGMKLYGSVAGSVEELKEQLADVRAELEAEQHA